MTEFKGAGALGGYVRAVFSQKARGHVVPLDLLRSLVSVRRIARVRAIFNGAKRGQRERLAAAFGDYLVSDADDLALRSLEIYGRKYAAKNAPVRAEFSSRRAEYQPVLDRMAVTGWVSGLAAALVMRSQGDGEEVRLTGWHLDAPGYMAAGGMRRNGADLFAGVDFVAPMLWSRP